jgi:hypothetical protein
MPQFHSEPLAHFLENPKLDTLIALLASVGTWLLGMAAKRTFRRFVRRGRTEAEEKVGPGVVLSRRVVDRLFPQLHLLLTRFGWFPTPPELEALQASLAQLGARNSVYYLPLRARPVPELTRFARGDAVATASREIRRIRQHVRLVLGPREGGDLATPQVAASSQRSRFVRNVVRVLTRAKAPLILLGDPGTGKSMTMGEVARTCAWRQRNSVFPSCVVLVRLSSIGIKGKVDQKLVDDLICKEMGASLANYYHKLLNQGRLIVLFDGMDEMPRHNYSEYVTALSEFGTQHTGRVKTLYSCRINDFSPAFVHRQLVLMPFDRKQIREYIKIRLPNGIEIDGRPITPNDVWHHITREEFPIEVSNPLILSFLVSHLEDNEKWPTSRSVLFEMYLRRNHRKVAESESLRRPRSRKLKFETAMEYWAALALTLTQRDRGASADVLSLEGWDTPDALAAVQEGVISGVLMEEEAEVAGSKAKIVRFAHHRVQEYLTAFRLFHYPIDMDWLEVLDEPRWQETALNLAGMDMDAQERVSEAMERWLSQFLAELGPKPSADLFSNAQNARLFADRTELAARIIREKGSTTSATGQQLTDLTQRAIAVLMTHGNPITQVKMLLACMLIRGTDFYGIARPALTSKIAWVRNQALMVAARFDAIRHEVSEAFSLELATDVATDRFIRRLPAYFSAAARTDNSVLRAHIGVATLSVLVRILLACAIVLMANVLISVLEWDRSLQWGIVPTLAATFWYFVFRRDFKLEKVIIISGVTYLLGYFVLSEIMKGKFESVIVILICLAWWWIAMLLLTAITSIIRLLP